MDTRHVTGEVPDHADLAGGEDHALRLEFFAQLWRQLPDLGPIAKKAKHTQTVAARAARAHVYCTVTFAVYTHDGWGFLPTMRVYAVVIVVVPGFSAVNVHSSVPGAPSASEVGCTNS